MNISKYEFDYDLGLVNLGDIHRGDEQCDVKALLRDIEFIRSHDNVRWVSTGDILNVALKSSKSNVYSSLSVERELAAIRKELAPIFGKCLGIVSSNHHIRVEREVGLCLDKMLAREFNIPYLGKLGLLNLKVGAACYYVAMHHGTGGGGMRGGKVNALARLSQIVPSADIYLEGHTHTFTSFINDVPYIDKKRNSFKQSKAWFVTTGHYLQWDGSYAQDMKLSPMPIGAAYLELRAVEGAGWESQKKVKVDLLG